MALIATLRATEQKNRPTCVRAQVGRFTRVANGTRTMIDRLAVLLDGEETLAMCVRAIWANRRQPLLCI